jgi:chaperonin GroES
MRLIPLNDKVLVKRDTSDDKTKGGLFIPEIAKKKMNRGKVIATGKGKTLPNGRVVEPSVKEGDEIIFGEWNGVEIDFADDKYLFLKDEEIFCVLEKE